MPASQSNMRLHLQYRLWIAELNSDITILRIFDDHLAQLSAVNTKVETRRTLENFSKGFSDARKEIDELKHEMHLVKMKLAANIRLPETEQQNAPSPNNHPAVDKRYRSFRKKFDNLKKDFLEFDSQG
ncbi:MAG TPA: hypothetical protein VEV83_11800 [Parafilimonas sp.]|nr:hypothetical protein [Parafilimonas sp.]